MKRALVLLAFLPLAAASDPATLAFAEEPDLVRELVEGTASWEVILVPSHAREAYLKVLPTPTNPAFNNGTVDGGGWWTEVLRDGVLLGATADGSVDLGAFAAGDPVHLTVRVHVPEAAADVAEHRLAYSFALRAQSDSDGSGGQLDPSRSFLPILRVPATPAPSETTAPEIPEQPGAEGTDTTPAAAWWQQQRVLGAAGVLAAVLLVAAIAGLLAWRRARRRYAEALRVLRSLDPLLGKLAEDEVRQFMQTPESRRYEELLDDRSR